MRWGGQGQGLPLPTRLIPLLGRGCPSAQRGKECRRGWGKWPGWARVRGVGGGCSQAGSRGCSHSGEAGLGPKAQPPWAAAAAAVGWGWEEGGEKPSLDPMKYSPCFDVLLPRSIDQRRVQLPARREAEWQQEGRGGEARRGDGGGNSPCRDGGFALLGLPFASLWLAMGRLLCAHPGDGGGLPSVSATETVLGSQSGALPAGPQSLRSSTDSARIIELQMRNSVQGGRFQS